MASKVMADRWEEIFRTEAWGKYPAEHVIRFVARRFYAAPDRRAVRLLDLGCGTGTHAWFMAREGFRVSAIDLSPTAIERARARFSAENLEGDLCVGDVAQLPWPDGTFDGVVDSAAITCSPLATMRTIVRDVYRVLKPGGWFFSQGFSDRSWGFGQGTSDGDGFFEEFTSGPFKGRGPMQLLSRAQALSLFGDFEEVSLEAATWTANGLHDVTEQWLTQGRKPLDAIRR